MRRGIAADNQFCTAAAYINHQAVVIIVGHRVSQALVHQPGLFKAGNNFDGVAEGIFGCFNKPFGFIGRPQGFSAHHTNLRGRNRRKALAKTRQTGEGAFCAAEVSPPLG